MAEERLKFRCYRCTQLISASRGRVGTVVDCPRCKAKLEVPPPEPVPARAVAGGEGGASEARPDGRTAPSLIDDIAAAIPDDLAALRPEDLRVEAEFAGLVVTTEPEPSRPDSRMVPAEALAADPPAPPTPPPVSVSIPLPPADPDDQAVLAGIQIEAASILPPGQEIRGVREVVLQPATVLAWSLLVLMSVPMAFLAGLLIGHFIWR